MSTKHTPGEWTVIVGTIITVGIQSKGAIAECRERPTLGGLPLSREQAIANAALIAAAPELLEACREGLTNLTCLSNSAQVPPHHSCDCCACEAGRVIEAAIAKAGGAE